jgi:hypothetical protein
MYSDYNSYKIFGKAIINWDSKILFESKMLDERLFYLGLGIIEQNEFFFRKVLLGEREDKGLSILGRAIVEGNTNLIEDIKALPRTYIFGKAILNNSLLELEALKYDCNLYNLAKAIILNDEAYLDLLNDNEVKYFFEKVVKTEFDGIKNVFWDHSFILQCLVCQDGILPDSNGYLNYFFASNENKSLNQTLIYFKETKRHLFYKFCSKECCLKWIN